MDRRYLTPEIESLAFGSFKMPFLSGPRKVGKTTLSKLLLGETELGAYYSWDDVVFRRQWVKDPKELVPAGKPNCKPLVISRRATTGRTREKAISRCDTYVTRRNVSWIS